MYGEWCQFCVHGERLLTDDQGEHGIGIGKKASLVRELGVDTIGVMQKLKASLDPLWIMNPGEIGPFRDERTTSLTLSTPGKIFDPPTSS